MDKIKKSVEIIKKDSELFLHFLKATFPVFHNSNFFFRDFQYGIKRYLEKKNINITVSEAEIIAEKAKTDFEGNGIFVKVNDAGWRINYPEFVTQVPGDPL